MGSSEKFCLRWNDFEANISSAFCDLKNEKDFSDVTLACADGQIEAHKVILAASSNFFKRILKKNPHKHPLIYLKGIKSSEVEGVLNFIYHGEVGVEETELNSFLQVAEELEVKGLVQDQQGKRHHESFSSMQQPLASKSAKQVQAPGSNMQSLDQMYVKSSSENKQESLISVSNNVVTQIKEELEDTIIDPATEEKQHQTGSLNHHQEQCSQFC